MSQSLELITLDQVNESWLHLHICGIDGRSSNTIEVDMACERCIIFQSAYFTTSTITMRISSISSSGDESILKEVVSRLSEVEDSRATCVRACRLLVALLFMGAIFSILGSTRSGSKDTILLVWMLPCIH